MIRIAAMSRRFPPNYKRLWYVVKLEGTPFYKCRVHGETVNLCFMDFHMLLDAMLEITRHARPDRTQTKNVIVVGEELNAKD